MNLRTKQELDNIDDICILLKYLYMSKKNNIIIKDLFGTTFLVHMNDDYRLYKVQITGDNHGKESSFDSDYSVHKLIMIIDQLKNSDAYMKDTHVNRWEEIKWIVETNLDKINKKN